MILIIFKVKEPLSFHMVFFSPIVLYTSKYPGPSGEGPPQNPVLLQCYFCTGYRHVGAGAGADNAAPAWRYITWDPLCLLPLGVVFIFLINRSTCVIDIIVQ